MPYSDQCGISRKIEDNKERVRLKRLVNELTIPEGMGFIVRTAGEGKKSRYFVRDLHLLLKTWAQIQAREASDRASACLYQEPDIVERQIEQTALRKVGLPSGGEIIIDETEALIAVDVNTGSHKNRGGDEKNVIYAVNLEAAAEISRQIRLRNLGGLIEGLKGVLKGSNANVNIHA